MQRFAVDSLLACVNGVIALAGALVLMLLLSARLTLLALLLIPAIMLFLRSMRPRVQAATRTVRERASDLSAFLVETLGAVKLIQSAGAEQRESSRLGVLQEAFRRDTLKLQMTNYVTSTVPGLLTSVSTAAVFVIGGYWTIQGQLTIGTLIAFSAYLARATGPVHTLLGLYVAVQRARVSIERVGEVRDAEPEVRAPDPPARGTGDLRGDICFDHVSFAFTPASPILRDVSFGLPAGSKVHVRGASGVGKTTLTDLLQRHHDPDSGAILLDGRDLREFDLPDLRRRVAVVAQDTVLFAGSILDNVRYANPDASLRDVHDALERAAVTAFAAEFPAGLDTPVGTRGTALSGGQRQRVAIARALLQDPLLLILDEATSGVEPEVEKRIVTAIDKLFAHRTRLIITHRPAVMFGCDYVLDVASDGTVSLDPVMR